jgi:hypothetical protein
MKLLPGMGLLLCAALASMVPGQTPPPSSMIRALGDVTAVDGNTKTLRLKTDAGGDVVGGPDR